MQPSNTPRSETAEQRLSQRAVLANALKQEARFGDGIEITINGDAVELRRKAAMILVVLSDDVTAERLANTLQPYLDRIASRQAGVLFVGNPPRPSLDALSTGAIAAAVGTSPSAETLFLGVQGLLDRVELRLDAKRVRSMSRYPFELGELLDISRALTQERNIDRLLGLILEKSRAIINADAGSIYVVEDVAGSADRTLRFKLSQNDSCDFESREFTMPVSARSIAGYTVLTRAPVRIDDVYEISSDAPYGFDRTFDDRVGYRTRSTMTMPLISAEDEVIGVVQLINRKKNPARRLSTAVDVAENVVPFDQRSQELLSILAAQAGIALENALLYEEINGIFDGLVRASVQAIEQRDPTTSGHSLRVSILSCRLAETVDRLDVGPYADTTFTRRELKELEYASLLHDFGKIGVREQVLVKAKKLYPGELSDIHGRVRYALKAAEAAIMRREVESLLRGATADVHALEAELEAQRAQLMEAWEFICEANEPTVLSEGDFTRIAEIASIKIEGEHGGLRSLLTPDEVMSLQVTRGSLKPRELEEIRSHVVHTYNFLSRIPWGKSFAEIPNIAAAHHEKVGGGGYPHGLRESAIPVRAKIMSVSDIYDALTARDRPYKKAVPLERALDILNSEVRSGALDPELVRVFCEAKVYESVSRM